MPDKDLTPADVERNRTMVRHLRTWISFRGLTQEQVANNLGVSTGSMSKWLGGTQSMSVGKFTALAELLNARPAQLLFPPEDVTMAETYERATGILSSMDPEALAQWLAVGEAMAQGCRRKFSEAKLSHGRGTFRVTKSPPSTPMEG